MLELAGAAAGGRRYVEIAKVLAARIAEGEFEPWTRLPPERELAAALNVSRTTIREALLALELTGRVEIRVGAGVYVVPAGLRSPQAVPEGYPDEPSPLEVLDLRRVIEGEAAWWAARRAASEEIDAMAAKINTMRRSLRNLPAYEEADSTFHRLIAETAGGVLRAPLVVWLWRFREGPMWERWYAKTRSVANRRRSVEGHERILRAIDRGLPAEAETAMKAHIDVLTERFYDLRLSGEGR